MKWNICCGSEPFEVDISASVFFCVHRDLRTWHRPYSKQCIKIFWIWDPSEIHTHQPGKETKLRDDAYKNLHRQFGLSMFAKRRTVVVGGNSVLLWAFKHIWIFRLVHYESTVMTLKLSSVLKMSGNLIVFLMAPQHATVQRREHWSSLAMNAKRWKQNMGQVPPWPEQRSPGMRLHSSKYQGDGCWLNSMQYTYADMNWGIHSPLCQ